MATINRVRYVLAGLALAGPIGCSSRHVMTRPASPPLEPAQAPLTEIVTEPTPEQSPAAEIPPEVVVASEPEPTAEAQPPAVEASPSRTDGRPEWWNSNPQYDHGRVQLCTEALGKGMSEAKELALDKARIRMREILMLGGEATIPGERVERTSVVPLPRPGGDRNFAGYVLFSADVK